MSAFVRIRDQENFGGPAEAFSEGWLDCCFHAVAASLFRSVER